VFHQSIRLLQLLILAKEFFVEVLQSLFLRLQVGFCLEDALGDAQVRLQLCDIERLAQKSVCARI